MTGTFAAAIKARLAGVVLATLLCGAALAQSGCGSISGCNGLTGFGNSPFSGCSGGQNIPPQSSINFLGTSGVVFSATVSDTKASYTFQGTVPLKVIYVNNQPPVRILATLQTPGVLSVQALTAFTTTGFASTTIPGTTVSVNVGGPLPAIASPPVCDVRFALRGPVSQLYLALLEQNNTAYENVTTAPTLYLLGGASGDVDGIFTESLPALGPLFVNLVINGRVAAVAGGTNFTVKSGCP
jgi:hypothetical protein